MIDIRPATPEDVPLVLPMVGQICAWHQSMDPARFSFRSEPGEMYRNWLTTRASDSRSVFLIAERSGKPPNETPSLIAFLVGTIEREIPIYTIKEYGFIHDLWVEPAYRHEGIARQMVMLAIERFKGLGVPQVRLETAAANEAARGLFAACGFRVSAVEMLLELRDGG